MVSYQDQQRSAIQYWLFFSDIETFLILVPSKKLEKSQNRKALFLWVPALNGLRPRSTEETNFSSNDWKIFEIYRDLCYNTGRHKGIDPSSS